MAVPGSDKKTRLCDRCFASVPADAATCPECGATLKGSQGLESSDAPIYPELSRANLLRMRGEYAAAEDQCLAILKRYPNNSTVHTLLGDIFAEQNDLDQAEQWYELALDLEPGATATQSKLVAVRERRRQREALSSSEQLGVPASPPNVPLFAALSLGSVLLVGLAAYFIGRSATSTMRPKPVVNAPVEAPVRTQRLETPGGTPSERSDSAPTRNLPQIDRELTAMVSARSSLGSNLLSLTMDPRNRVAMVTFSSPSDGDDKRAAAELGRTVLEQNGEVQVVTLRAVREDRVVYVADVTRSRWDEVQAGSVPPENWVNHVVTNEWPAARNAATPPAPEPVVEAPAPASPGFTPPLAGGTDG